MRLTKVSLDLARKLLAIKIVASIVVFIVVSSFSVFVLGVSALWSAFIGAAAGFGTIVATGNLCWRD